MALTAVLPLGKDNDLHKSVSSFSCMGNEWENASYEGTRETEQLSQYS